MIAIADRTRTYRVPAWHEQFLAMVPTITTHACICFRNFGPEAREDLVQEVLANCLVAFDRLSKMGKADLAYPSVLARYAVAQVRHGRRIGGRPNANDVSSTYAQRRNGIVVERLDEQGDRNGSWREIVVEDRRATPADTAACRIDFRDWLGRLSAKQQRIAKLLATGEKSSTVAKRFHLTDGRISQMRKELQVSWDEFQKQANSPAT